MKKEKGPSLSFAYQSVLVACVAFGVYSNALTADFVYDDRPAILTNDDVISASASSWRSLLLTNDFWGNPIGLEGSHKSYRPLITASFRVQAAAHGFHAVWFHGVNVLCHVINSILVLKLAKQLRILEDGCSLFAALLFSCHPITSEAVCSIVGRADLLATTFILMATISHLQHPSARVSVALSILAVLSKETGIILLPLISAYELLFKGTQRKHDIVRRDLTRYSIAFGLICYLRMAINNFQSPTFSKNDNPIAHDPSWTTRTSTFLYLPIFHLWLMIFPKTLSFDWSMDAIPKVESILDSRLFGALIVYGTALGLVWNLKKKSKKSEESKSLLFVLTLLAAPHLISSNLLTYVGFVAAERILYLPAVGYCILVTFGVQLINKRLLFPNSSVNFLLLILLALHAQRTMNRVEDWQSEESLFKSALSVNPTKAHMNLGFVYTTQKKYDLARHHYLQALRRKGNLADAWYNLGILTSKSKNGIQEAMRCYHQALMSRSNFAAAHLNLALLYHDSGNQQKAFEHLDQCLTVSGENLKSYRSHIKMKATCAFNKGRLLQKAEKYPQAIRALKLALELGGPHFEHATSVLNSIGTCYSQIGDELAAEHYFEKAIQENHVNSYLTMAHLKIRQNKSVEVEKLFDRVMILAPDSITVLQNIALAEFHMRNYNRSMLFYQRALAVEPAHVESLRGMANLLQETHHHLEAEKFYRKVVDLQPESYESHANLGAILHLNQKYEAALKAYDSALEINPNDGITRENREKLIRILKRRRNLLLIFPRKTLHFKYGHN
ncbi:unnamed protein product [Caenorhabditis sp. 36 PRJEB53466]|nr:unnamed protein product [Caenorhabditis sp. 36 PRJEB53466]